MPHHTTRLPSPALVISVCALLVALGGTTYAVAAIPKHSVGPAQLKRGAVTSKAVKNHSLKVKDLRAGLLPPSEVLLKDSGGDTVDLTAVAGTPPDTVVSSMALPAGTFYVQAHVLAINKDAVLTGDLRCSLESSGDTVAAGTFGLFQSIEPDAGSNDNRTTFTLDAAYQLARAGTVIVECNKGSAGQDIAVAATLSALAVSTAVDVP